MTWGEWREKERKTQRENEVIKTESETERERDWEYNGNIFNAEEILTLLTP